MVSKTHRHPHESGQRIVIGDEGHVKAVSRSVVEGMIKRMKARSICGVSPSPMSSASMPPDDGREQVGKLHCVQQLAGEVEDHAVPLAQRGAGDGEQRGVRGQRARSTR